MAFCFERENRSGFLLFDARFLSGDATEVENAGATDDTALVHDNLVDLGRVEREYTLDTHAVGDLAHRKCLRKSGTFTLKDNALILLDTLLVSLDDLVVNGYRVTRLEGRNFALFDSGFGGDFD
jgi:hypothetical protein